VRVRKQSPGRYRGPDWRSGDLGIAEETTLFRRARTELASSSGLLSAHKLIADLADEVARLQREIEAAR
jgi:hypothetical protein